MILEAGFNTDTYLVSENRVYTARNSLILLIFVFFCKDLTILGKNSTFIQRNSISAVLKIFLALFSVSVRLEVVINEKLRIMDHAPKIHLPVCFKLDVNWKNGSYIIVFQNDVIIKIFWRHCASLINIR